MPLSARVLRTALVGALTAACAVGLGEHGFWICIPAALLLAAAERTPYAGAVAALAVSIIAGVVAPPPAPAPAAAVPLSVGVLLLVRTRLERERDEMRRFALRDPLTELFNRRALDARLDYEVARHRRHRERFLVLVLDLDGFKSVNDRFGHDAGDDILRDVAGALVTAVRAQDTVARLGGDEFCVLAPQTDRAGADRLLARVDAALSSVTAGLTGVSASVGVAEFPSDAQDPGRLLAIADSAALGAKRERRALRRGVA
jgi:diguanylate cyclase (GGDEF)-like protein